MEAVLGRARRISTDGAVGRRIFPLEEIVPGMTRSWGIRVRSRHEEQFWAAQNVMEYGERC